MNGTAWWLVTAAALTYPLGWLSCALRRDWRKAKVVIAGTMPGTFEPDTGGCVHLHFRAEGVLVRLPGCRLPSRRCSLCLPGDPCPLHDGRARR